MFESNERLNMYWYRNSWRRWYYLCNSSHVL